MTTDTLIFVYGTLRSGCSNHEQMLRPCCEHEWVCECPAAAFRGRALTNPGAWDLWDLGGFPALRPAEPGDETAAPVRGELWLVPPPLLSRLDRFEGVPRLYVRGAVGLASGMLVDAYIFARPPPPGSRRIMSGDWMRR